MKSVKWLVSKMMTGIILLDCLSRPHSKRFLVFQLIIKTTEIKTVEGKTCFLFAFCTFGCQSSDLFIVPKGTQKVFSIQQTQMMCKIAQVNQRRGFSKPGPAVTSHSVASSLRLPSPFPTAAFLAHTPAAFECNLAGGLAINHVLHRRQLNRRHP